jgi:hypothetical protein
MLRKARAEKASSRGHHAKPVFPSVIPLCRHWLWNHSYEMPSRLSHAHHLQPEKTWGAHCVGPRYQPLKSSSKKNHCFSLNRVIVPYPSNRVRHCREPHKAPIVLPGYRTTVYTSRAPSIRRATKFSAYTGISAGLSCGVQSVAGQPLPCPSNGGLKIIAGVPGLRSSVKYMFAIFDSTKVVLAVLEVAGVNPFHSLACS